MTLNGRAAVLLEVGHDVAGGEVFQVESSPKAWMRNQPNLVMAFQAMLFEGQNCYIMLGMMGNEQREAYLPVFKGMAGRLGGTNDGRFDCGCEALTE